MKKYVFLAAMNLMVAAVCSYFAFYAAYHCGYTKDKPILALGLSPGWSDAGFQINRDVTSIISSSPEEKPYFDKWIKGSELYKTIIAYDIEKNDSGVLFKAIDWHGVERIYNLREYTRLPGEEYSYEVVEQNNMTTKPEWISVTTFACLESPYRGYCFLILLVVFILDALLGFKVMLILLKRIWSLLKS